MEFELPELSDWDEEDIRNVLNRAGTEMVEATMTLDDVLETWPLVFGDDGRPGNSGLGTVEGSSSGVEQQEETDCFRKDENGVWSFGQATTASNAYRALPADKVSVTWQNGDKHTLKSGYDMSQLSGLMAEISRKKTIQENEQALGQESGQMSQGVEVHLRVKKAWKVVVNVGCIMPVEAADTWTEELGLS